MPKFLTLYNTYTTVEVGIFAGDQQLDAITLEHTLASKELMTTIAQLLSKHAMSLTDLQFIAAHQGPGPFTTIRVIIASVNGLSFATNIPLIGINGLELLVLERNKQNPNAVVVGLLNAFGNDLYYGVAHQQTIVDFGYKAGLVFLEDIATRYPEQSIIFIGNGIPPYQTAITTLFGSYAIIQEPLLQYCSLSTIARNALEQWQHGICHNQLQPLYIKPHQVFS